MKAFYYALLTACIWGMVPIFEKLGLARVTPAVGLFYRGFGVIIGLGILAVTHTVSGISLKADLWSICFLVTGGLLASFIGQFFFYRALKTGDASLVVPVTAVYPLVAFIIGVTMLQERLTAGKIFGMLMIIAGVIFLRGK